MTLIQIPTPLRPYTEGQKQIMVKGDTIGLVIRDLTSRYPDLRQHLFNASGDLRPYVNIFINQEDIRTLEGEETPVMEGDRLMIVPSIAGGSESSEESVLIDHAAIRTNQACIITILVTAFIVDLPLLVDLTSFISVLLVVSLAKPFSALFSPN